MDLKDILRLPLLFAELKEAEQDKGMKVVQEKEDTGTQHLMDQMETQGTHTLTKYTKM